MIIWLGEHLALFPFAAMAKSAGKTSQRVLKDSSRSTVIGNQRSGTDLAFGENAPGDRRGKERESERAYGLFDGLSIK